jgi:hypothetical protein
VRRHAEPEGSGSNNQVSPTNPGPGAKSNWRSYLIGGGAEMLRAVVSKRLLDRMIRDKVRKLIECENVDALPVVWRERLGLECNWEVPGWSGASEAVKRCTASMTPYLEFLGSQFDIPEEGSFVEDHV